MLLALVVQMREDCMLLLLLTSLLCPNTLTRYTTNYSLLKLSLVLLC
jgi:hypothetical protein